MNLTPKLKLKKPLTVEKYDINVFNSNCDTVDSAVSDILSNVENTTKETDKALRDLEAGKADAALIGVANGIAPLDSARKIPSPNIPFGNLASTCFEGNEGQKLRDEFDSHVIQSDSGIKHLEDSLAAETGRAAQAENALREDLSGETVMARNAEKEIADAIAAEARRALVAEEQIEGGLNLHMQSASAEFKTLHDTDNALETKKANKTDVEAALAERYTKDQTYSRQEVLDKIEALIGAAPDTLDTFKEIADALGNDPDFAATIMNTLAGKVDREDGKALSSNNYSDDEKVKVQASYDTRHSHSNKTVLDRITQSFLDSWTDAYNKKHEHGNKGVLDGITSALIISWNSAATHISDAVKHITAAERTNWNDADSKKHIHTNKSILDTITQALLTRWNTVDNKVDKVTGKGLSANDFTTALLTKLNGIADGANNYTHPATSGNKHIPSGGSTGQILRWSADGTASWGTDNNTNYSDFKGATASAAGTTGLVPAPASGKQGQFLRGDGTWAAPANTTYGTATQTASGLMAAADKKKLDGIAAGAQVNSLTGVKGNGESSYRTGNVNLTPANIGAAPSSHTHTKSQITDMPTALKNPNTLTIQSNGTTIGTYDGGEAKTINISSGGSGMDKTPAAIVGGITNTVDYWDTYPNYSDGSIIMGENNHFNQGRNSLLAGENNTLQYKSSVMVGAKNSLIATGVNGGRDIICGYNNKNSTNMSLTNSIMCGGSNLITKSLSGCVIYGGNNQIMRSNSCLYGGNYCNDTDGNNYIVIGAGSGSSPKNAFKVTGAGAFALNFTGGGADYAEMFEWEDGNPDNEDRRGLFVTLNKNKISIANSMDENILGIISGNPTVKGNEYDSWKDIHLRDRWGNIIFEDVLVPAITETDPETGEVTIIEDEYYRKAPITNPEYDSTKEYVCRSERKEWDPVGVVGQIIAYDDGTCLPGGYCTVGKGGIATATDKSIKISEDMSTFKTVGWYVMERLATDQILIWFK